MDLISKTVSILGCGWLGFPLAKELKKNGYRVKGSTTSQNKFPVLKDAKIEPYEVFLNPEVNGEFVDDFFDADILIVAIPPGIRGHGDGSFYIQQMKSLIHHLNHSLITFVVFISSTSVYPELNRDVQERDTKGLPRDNDHALLKVEDMFLDSQNNFESTIIRFGGLYGYDRHPARFLAGKTNLMNGNAPVNMIHLDDSVRILYEIIHQDIHKEIFNACTDEHPTRKEYYTAMARRLNLKPPTFQDDSNTSFKIVSNEKLKRILNYSFLYPSPFDGSLNNGDDG